MKFVHWVESLIKFQIFFNFSGHCPNCKKSLDVVTLTNDEFRSVQRYFLEKVVHGKNIYYKTTPEEWSSFVNLIDKNGPFDVVMDGLNIAFESEFAAGKNEGKKARPNMKTVSNFTILLKFPISSLISKLGVLKTHFFVFVSANCSSRAICEGT